MTGWKLDKKWSDRFLPEIKRTLGEHLIGEPPQEEDEQRNTDLIVLKMEPVRIACRVRKHQYFQKYKDEFTIRSGRPSGVKTELVKIMEGWGDYFFYGFADQEEVHLCQWLLGDLKAFRLFFYKSHCLRKMPWTVKENVDASSSFFIFRFADIPGFVVGFQQNVQEKQVDENVHLKTSTGLVEKRDISTYLDSSPDFDDQPAIDFGDLA